MQSIHSLSREAEEERVEPEEDGQRQEMSEGIEQQTSPPRPPAQGDFPLHWPDYLHSAPPSWKKKKYAIPSLFHTHTHLTLIMGCIRQTTERSRWEVAGCVASVHEHIFLPPPHPISRPALSLRGIPRIDRTTLTKKISPEADRSALSSSPLPPPLPPPLQLLGQRRFSAPTPPNKTAMTISPTSWWEESSLCPGEW